MITLQASNKDFRRVRFAASPLRETVMSLRVLAAARSGPHLHRPWRVRVASAVAELAEREVALLTAIVRPQGYIPDFLAPSPLRRWPSFAHEVAVVAKTDPEIVARELAHLAGHRLAQQGPGLPERQRVLQELVDRPDAGIDLVVTALTTYHDKVIAPFWPRIRSLLQLDIGYRLQALADGGVDRMMRDLHPSVRLAGDEIRIVKYYEGTTRLDGRGLLLMPSAFAWPDVIVRTARPFTPAMSYSPRGIARLWEEHPDETDSALTDVIGGTRSALLSQLDLPMSTTQAAAQLALSAPTVNVHLKAMHRCGLITSFRDGRRVLYGRTDLGEQLLLASQAR